MRVRPAHVLMFIALAAPAAVAADVGDSPPEERIRQVAEAAWSGPDLAAARAALEAEAAAARVDDHQGAPYTELQREGISAFYNEAGNATWYLRFGTPFNAPWFSGSIRDSREGTERYVAAMSRAAALEAAGHAAGAWLELAAADERLAVRQAQVERLERALELQRKRLELGEVSGAEVKQLELERLRLVVEKNAHRVQRINASEDLARLAGPGAPGPRPGDLRRLSEGFRPVRIQEQEVGARIESSPAMTASALDTERIRLDGERDRRTVWGRPEAELGWEHIPAIDGVDGFDAWGFRLRFRCRSAAWPSGRPPSPRRGTARPSHGRSWLGASWSPASAPRSNWPAPPTRFSPGSATSTPNWQPWSARSVNGSGSGRSPT